MKLKKSLTGSLAQYAGAHGRIKRVFNLEKDLPFEVEISLTGSGGTATVLTSHQEIESAEGAEDEEWRKRNKI